MIRRLLKSLLSIVSPQQCVCCGCRLGVDESVICTTCDLAMPRRQDHLNPMENSTARLFWGIAKIERCASWIDYESQTSCAKAIYALKYGNRPDIGFALGKVVADELLPTGFFDGIDCIVPLPLHRKRQRERGYNQSREFALGLCSVLHIDLCDDAVERLRNTKSQASLVHGERSTNIKDAFGVVRPEALNGKHVLMVDDIVTTGATLSECIKAINKDTDARVSILTIGRAKH